MGVDRGLLLIVDEHCVVRGQTSERAPTQGQTVVYFVLIWVYFYLGYVT